MNPPTILSDRSSLAPDENFQTLEVLQKLRAGQFDPKQFAPCERRQLVMFLVAEGQSTAEIALLFETSDRTIERDRKALREEFSLVKDPQLTAQMAGRLLMEAELCIQRIRKCQRDPDATATTKIEGEYRCFQIYSQLTERLQSMGFVESVTQRIDANITHQLGPFQSLEEISQEVDRLKRINPTVSEENIGVKQGAAPLDGNAETASTEGSENDGK